MPQSGLTGFPLADYTRLRQILLGRAVTGVRAADPQSPEFRAMVEAILSQLGTVTENDDQSWRVILAPPGYVGVSVNGGEIYASSASGEHATVDLAGKLQENAIDVQWRAAPACLPGHQHPPQAELYGGVAMWMCPRLHASVRPIMPDQSGPPPGMRVSSALRPQGRDTLLRNRRIEPDLAQVVGPDEAIARDRVLRSDRMLQVIHVGGTCEACLFISRGHAGRLASSGLLRAEEGSGVGEGS